MFVTIVIPTLNEEDYIGILLHSLAAQTYKNFEVIVVDGGSKDETQGRVLEFQGLLNLKFVKAPKKGVARQRNFGASLAKSEHLMFMDADDYLDPDFMEKVTTHLKSHTSIDLLTTWLKPLSDKMRDRVMFYSFHKFYMDLVKKWKPVAGGAFIYIKKSVFMKLKGFRADLLVAEDFDLVYRAHEAGYKYDLLKKPPVHTSVRRLEQMGRPKYLWSLGKNAIYYQFRNVTKNVDWLVDYDLKEGGFYYKNPKARN